MKKYIWLMFFILVNMVNISGCSAEKNISEAEFEVQECTFEEIVASSDIALWGEYIESYEYEHYVEHKFKVNEVLYGTVSDSEIYLYVNEGIAHVEESGYTYDMDSIEYEKDKEYLLIMEKSESIMYDHDRYLLSAELLLCETDRVYTLYSQPIDIPNDESIETYLLSMIDPLDYQTATEISKVYLDNIDEMIHASEYIGAVKILELYIEGEVHNGNTYRCTVESLVKGENLNTYEDETILLTILKDTVSVGNTYIIGFSPVNEGSLIYMQTSVNGVQEFSNELLSDISEKIDVQ